jgi:hypothetical protein
MTNPPKSPLRSRGYGDPVACNPTSQPRLAGGRMRPPRDPLSIALVIITVLALGVATLVAGELYVRHQAKSVMVKAVECEVNDRASVSFGARSLLLQAVAGTYSGISIQTAGNRIREAKGMKLNLRLDDMRLRNTSSSRGTLGSLEAFISWSNQGIKQSLQEVIPLFGALVTGVTTDPSTGTIELHGGLGSITARPLIAHSDLALEVVRMTGLGLAFARQTIQPTLDAFTSSLSENLPMGIHADSVQVTESGVTGRFSTRDATIPPGGSDPCLTGL